MGEKSQDTRRGRAVPPFFPSLPPSASSLIRIRMRARSWIALACLLVVVCLMHPGAAAKARSKKKGGGRRRPPRETTDVSAGSRCAGIDDPEEASRT